LRSIEEKIAIYVGDLESRERRRVMAARSNAIYASPGFLLFLREHTLMAQPFDAGKLETTGDPFPIVEQVNFTTSATGQFSASQNGVLAYISGLQGGAQLTWFDRSGKTLGTVGSPMETRGPAISPDGKTVAFERLDPQTGFNDIWLHDLARGTDSRFTFNSKNNLYPIWSPDGSYIAFASNRNGRFNVYRKATGGTGQDEIVDRDALISFPDDWSPDGRYLLADSDPSAPKTLSDIWVAPMARGRSAGKPYPYLQTEFSEGLAKVSPNGQWLAYSSNETKRNEVYVMTFPNPGGKVADIHQRRHLPSLEPQRQGTVFRQRRQQDDGGRHRCLRWQARSWYSASPVRCAAHNPSGIRCQQGRKIPRPDAVATVCQRAYHDCG
jgi:hypothetical protein